MREEVLFLPPSPSPSYIHFFILLSSIKKPADPKSLKIQGFKLACYSRIVCAICSSIDDHSQEIPGTLDIRYSILDTRYSQGIVEGDF